MSMNEQHCQKLLQLSHHPHHETHITLRDNFHSHAHLSTNQFLKIIIQPWPTFALHSAAIGKPWSTLQKLISNLIAHLSKHYPTHTFMHA